jgi:hypothetical protein
MRFRVVGKNVRLFFFWRRLPWFLQLVTNRSHLFAIIGVLISAGPAVSENTSDWLTGLPREPIHVKAWPVGKKVAVCFILYVEVWGFGHGQPHIQISTLDLLLDAARKNPTCICQPTFHGRAAHPTILPASNFRELAQNDTADLRTYIRAREAFRLRLQVEDPGVSEDLNTPEDYARWKQKEPTESDLHSSRC